MFFSRPDGRLAKDVPPFRQIMPFIMPTRNESAVYFEQELDLTQTLRVIESYNQTHQRKITVFHILLWAVVQTIHERPRLNRFVMGSRIYEREGIWISFSAKKKLQDDSPIVVIKRRFEPEWTFDQTVEQIHGDISEGKSEKISHVDKELSLFLKLPVPLLRWGVRFLRWLDSWNLLPGSFINPDPMYASLFIANLGSVRLDAAFHHLYEYGTIPLFAALGRTKKVMVPTDSGGYEIRQVCRVRYTLDERIEDGLYCASALERVKTLVESGPKEYQGEP